MDSDSILDAYRKGDQGERLRLFLAFRDLRDHFSRIDEESPDSDFFILKCPINRNQPFPRAA